MIAFAFGLLHGMGFASGLRSLGLDRAALLGALVLFNVGVEIGQLAFIAVVLALRRSFRLDGHRLAPSAGHGPHLRHRRHGGGLGDPVRDAAFRSERMTPAAKALSPPAGERTAEGREGGRLGEASPARAPFTPSGSSSPIGAGGRDLTGAVFVFLLGAMLPVPALAHIVKGEGVGFISGFRHPISGLDHIIAMVAVGLWGAQLGRPAIWALPVTFPLVMAFGGFLGLIGVRVPGSEIAIALSGLLLGAAVCLEWRPPLAAAAMLVGVFGLFHGYAHGAELPPGQNALLYSLGFVLATGLLHACGIAIGLLHRWRWGQLAVRGAGAAIACGGAFFLWTAVA